MFNKEIQDALAALGVVNVPGVSELSFEVGLEERKLGAEDFALALVQGDDESLEIQGQNGSVHIRWIFEAWNNGYFVKLEMEKDELPLCQSLAPLVLNYEFDSTRTGWRVPTLGTDVLNVGLYALEEIDESHASSSMMRGIFPDSRNPGLFLGSRLPQHFLHLYTLEKTGEGSLRFSARTSFPDGPQRATRLCSETTWVCTTRSLRHALDAYSEHLPLLPSKRSPVGWNSWDYYFFTVSLDDMIENMEAIQADPRLSAQVKYIVVDAGWEHQDGEWQPNYKFPGSPEYPDGMTRLAAEIRRRGFIPGLWSAAVFAHPFCKIAMRDYDMLIKNEYGDPEMIYGRYIVDPTHPKGENFLRTTYTRLYQAGFRLFKIDFIDALVFAKRFHDPTKGPYEALQHLFTIIRECITEESHLLGCSFPQECGPGYCDSQRTGIDIHNQWTHIEWAIDYLQLGYWWHERISTADPDFLVVRGTDTSIEAETNVLNPAAHHPNPPRWRRGPVFHYEEAKTWASIVSLSGGNVFLGDRISMLNERGKELAARVLSPSSSPAKPLDCGDGAHASLWLAGSGNRHRLGIINWTDQTEQRLFAFTEYGLDTPADVQDFWTDEKLPVVDGCLTVTVPPHGCALVEW